MGIKKYILISLFASSLANQLHAESNSPIILTSNIVTSNTIDSNQVLGISSFNNTLLNQNNLSQNSNLSLSQDHLTLAWSLSDGISLHMNLFENTINSDALQNNSNNYYFNPNNYNQLQTQKQLPSIGNQLIQSYSLGVASKYNLGPSYLLDLNLNIGRIEGANLLGFSADDIQTTTLGIGLRKSNFGAKLNTNFYLDSFTRLSNSSTLDFEFNWHFSDNGILTFGTQKPMSSSIEATDSFDSVLGNVQYIKFQHNL